MKRESQKIRLNSKSWTQFIIYAQCNRYLYPLKHANLFNVMSLEVFSSMLNSLLINYVAYYLPRDH